MSENLRETFGRSHGSQLKAIAYSVDPRSIRPETYSGVCMAVGQILSCLGLASNEGNAQDRDAPDLAIG